MLRRAGELGLSTWQNLFLCDFDSPRERRTVVCTLRAGRTAGDVAGFAFVSVIVMALYAGVLYGLRLWWTVFQETAVGGQFLDPFGERALLIETFLAQPLWVVTGQINLATAAAGLAVGAVGWCLAQRLPEGDPPTRCPTRSTAVRWM